MAEGTLGCTRPPRQCRPRVFLYVGSDVDVSLLRYLQPWETLAVFWDDFSAPDLDFSGWTRAHSDDSRSSYRTTTAALRPYDPNRHMEAMASLVLGRLHDTSGIEDARRTGNLSFKFELGGKRRRLLLRTEPLNQMTLSKWRPRIVSTLSTVGYFPGPEIVRQLIALAPTCLPAARLLTIDSQELRSSQLTESGISARLCGRYEEPPLGRSTKTLRAGRSYSGGPGGGQQGGSRTMTRLAGALPVVALCVAPPLSVAPSLTGIRPRLASLAQEARFIGTGATRRDGTSPTCVLNQTLVQMYGGGG